MLYKALVSFSGAESMAMGEIRELTDESIVNDLLKAGYIMKWEADKKADEVPAEKPKKKGAKKK